LHVYADLFCEFYDALDSETTRERAEGWLADDGLRSFAEAVRSDVEGDRGAVGIRMRALSPPAGETAPDVESRRFAALVGLDRAFGHVIPVKATLERTPTSLIALAAYVEAQGRLDSGRHGGALLPRLVRRGRYDENDLETQRSLANTDDAPQRDRATATATLIERFLAELARRG
jgi:hypothetical protein